LQAIGPLTDNGWSVEYSVGSEVELSNVAWRNAQVHSCMQVSTSYSSADSGAPQRSNNSHGT